MGGSCGVAKGGGSLREHGDERWSEIVVVCFFYFAGYVVSHRNKLTGEEIYGVPEVIRELSGKRVLTTELVGGVPIDKVAALDQDDRNFVSDAHFRERRQFV